jgi:hypothetical protein
VLGWWTQQEHAAASQVTAGTVLDSKPPPQWLDSPQSAWMPLDQRQNLEGERKDGQERVCACVRTCKMCACDDKQCVCALESKYGLCSTHHITVVRQLGCLDTVVKDALQL